MVDIGKAFGVTLPAVTQLVDRLEQKGFITRADDPGDRRAYVLEVTRAGAALVDELHAMRLRSLEAVLARMTADDRTRVVRGLEALVEASAESAR
jgi:DNA-binding MarR family transcriptional regulator